MWPRASRLTHRRTLVLIPFDISVKSLNLRIAQGLLRVQKRLPLKPRGPPSLGDDPPMTRKGAVPLGETTMRVSQE